MVPCPLPAATDQRAGPPPPSTLPDPAPSTPSTFLLSDSVDKLNEVQDHVEEVFVPNTMNRKIHTLQQQLPSPSLSPELVQNESESATKDNNDLELEVNRSNSQTLELQIRNQELMNHLEDAILEKNNFSEELALVKKQMVEKLSSNREENTAEED